MKKLLTFLTLLTLFFGVGWAEEVTDHITRSTTGVNEGSSSYSDWSGKTCVDGSTAVYAGNSAGGNAAIQLRSDKSTSGIVSTTSGGKIKKVIVNWNSNTASGRTLDIYGSNTAYTSPTELYGNNITGTKLGSIVKGTSTELDITDDYTYIGLRSNSGAMYIVDIRITWETGGGSTTETCATPTFSPAAGTYYEPQSVTLSCATPGSTIYYTTDGSTPTTSSAEYSSAITVSETTTIKAIATADGMDPSSIATAAYTIASSGGNTGSGRMTFVQTSSSAGTLTNAPSGVTATFSNTYTNNKEQITKGNTMTLTISGMPSRYKITGVTLNVHNNASSGNGSANITMNGTSIGTMTITGLGSTYSEQDVNITECPFTGDLVITLNCTTNSVYCNAFYIDYEEIPAKAYDVTVTQGANGTITASPSGQKVVDAGDKITVTATPDPGYELDTWTITGAQETEPDANNQITATGDVTITASFKLAKNKVEYTIAPTNSGNVWLESGAPYDETLGYSTSEMGTTVTIKLVPYSGYEINTLTITDANGATVSYTTGASDWSGDSYGTHYTFTMPATAVTIAATFKNGDIYILGTANDNAWAGNVGVPMTFNATANTYTARVYFKGDSDADEEVLGYGRFSFADRLGNADWSNMGKRFGANGGDNYDLSQHDWSGGWTDKNQSDPNAFMLPAGIYDITVNWGTGVVSAVKVNPTVSLDKASGTLEAGTTVNVSSNLTTLLSAIKSGVSATLAYSTDNGSNYTDGSSFDVNSAMTAKGKAYYGYIEAESDAYEYTVVTHYAVTATANPTAGGTVTVSPASALAGETVTITATPKSGYELTSITVNGEPLEAVEGVYSFTMPAQAVEVVANFSKINYTITTSATKCTITGAPATANAGDVINFTVTPSSGSYEIRTVTVTWDDGTTGTVQLTNNGDGNYSFTMVAHPVTITAVCAKASTGDGSYILVTDASTLNAGDKVIIANSGTAGSALAMAGDKGNNRDSESVTITSDLKITPGENVQILTLESTTATVDEESVDGWMFNTGDGKYLYAGSSSNNYLKTGTASAAGENGKATISIGNSNNAVITFRGSNTRNIIRNNGSLFACYSSGQSPVYLYKQTVTGVTVSIEPNGGDVVGTQNVVVDASTETAVVRYKVGENGTWSEWAEGPVNFDITGNVGDTKVVYAEAKEPNQELEPGEEEEVAETDATFHFVLPDAPSITPASCSVVDVKQNVTITSEYANGVIEYSTDGGDTWNTYDGAFDVILSDLGTSVTVTARVTVNGVQSETVSATYTRNVQPVVFSPVSGTYYYGEQSVEMFSISQGARIYYSMTDDGSEPADPLMNDGGTLYTGPIEDLEPGKTYKFKAYAYIGTIKSEISNAEYTIEEALSGAYWLNIAEMNEDNATTSKYLENPVQVVYMSTYQNNGTTPEFCYVRDNSGYGLIYFAKNHTAYNGYTKFHMGDWLPGKSVEGKIDTWNDGFHNELGSSSGTIYKWPATSEGNTAIIPETVTNAQVKAGWDGDSYTSTSGYASGVTENNLWGHYIHLRKNQISNLTTIDNKYKGIMTDENNDVLTYYDAFYKFSGFGSNSKEYDSNFYTSRQNKGATFDFYGIVAFYGKDITSSTYANQPFQIIPIDILWVYKPVISGVNSTDVYTTSKTVSLDLDPVQGDDESNSVIWYKTSEMEDFAIYTGPFEVSTSTTIETYTTKMTSYNDRMESLVTTMDVHFTTINPPVISPESTVKAIGSESVNSTITRDASDGLSDVVIFFTIDGSDPSDPNSTRYEYTAANQAAYLSDIRTTTTVRAIAAVYNQTSESYVYSAEAEARTYTFVKSNGIVYDLVTNVSQLTSNGVYVIVSRAHSEAMSNVQNTSNRGAAGVMFVPETDTPNYHGEEQSIYGNDDVAVFTLTPLTDATDTGNEKHFLFHTSNGKTNAATGYLHVGANDDNTLLTEAEEDAMGNDVAVITIDADGRAHIHFNYSGQDNRYLQYWNRDRLFNTYKSEYDDRAVYIYYKNATPLATIEKEGVTTEGKNQYTIADQLIAVVYRVTADGVYLWCKDQGDVSINKTEIQEGQFDFLMNDANAQNGRDWDQSNWVVLKLTASNALDLATSAKGHYLDPASVTGFYVNDVNYMIEVNATSLSIGDKVSYTPNVYSPANFMLSNLNINGGKGGQTVGSDKYYFFMNPKVQEYCKITYAEWYTSDASDAYFTVPYTSGFDGAFTLGGWQYNEYGSTVQDNLVDEQSYYFHAFVQRSSKTSYGPKAIVHNTTPDGAMIVYPADLKADQVITAINTVDVAGNGEVKSVKYVNVAGVVSDKPFSGVNIVVTEYTDGSRSTTKMLRK